MVKPKLRFFIVHCGFYDPNISSGLWESHTNLLIAALNLDDARARAKARPDFKKLKMHVDGIQEVVAVDGHRVELIADESFDGKTLVRRQKYGSTKEQLIELEAQPQDASGSRLEK